MADSDYSYDAFGRLVGLVYHQGATPLAHYSWTYGNSGSNGDALSDGYSYTTTSSAANLLNTPAGQAMLPLHDTQNFVAALMRAAASGDVGTYLTAIDSVDGLVQYTYDATGQLTGATYTGGALADEAYTWDANGNPAGSGYIIGADNRLLSDGTFGYSYDPEGNRTARFIDVDQSGTLTTGDTDVTEYAWDARNRLIEVVQRATADGDPTQVVEYLYDVENRWVGEDIDSDGDGQVDHQTRFAYDITSPLYAGTIDGEAGQIVLQFDRDLTSGESTAMTAADLSHRYLWLPDAVDQLLADEQLLSVGEGGQGHDLTQPGNVLWALNDHLGTVRDLATLDVETGVTSVANRRVFDSFGNLQSQTNAAVDTIFGFTGRPSDRATGLQNNLHRIYDARTGQWMSKDPIEQIAGDANTRRYCENSPAISIDATGLQQKGKSSPSDWKSIARRAAMAAVEKVVPQAYLTEIAKTLGMPNPETATASKIRDYINRTAWELKSKQEIEVLRAKVASAKNNPKYSMFLGLAKRFLESEANARPNVDDLAKRMTRHYFETSPANPNTFTLTLEDMKRMASGADGHDITKEVSIRRHPKWTEAMQRVLASQKEETFNGTIIAGWDNGSIGNYTVHFEGKIVPVSASTVRWEGIIWFTDKYDFDPDWKWKEGSFRSKLGERRVRIAYILNLGTNYPVDSVYAYARQSASSTFAEQRVRITGQAPKP